MKKFIPIICAVLIFLLSCPALALTSADAPTTQLQKGDKGADVTVLQERLNELGYSVGTADGAYGGKTEKSITAFQKRAKLPQTGVADLETIELLFSEDAPVQPVYESHEYKDLARDPALYEGKNYQFSGNVLQVMEDDTYADTLGVYVAIRLATKGNYDDVVYITYWRPKTESRILEDDKITVWGEYSGLYSYTTVMGATVTIPSFSAELIQ